MRPAAKISIFGLGYVGSVMAACLARAGHRVWGVDINPEKVQTINEGSSPIVEKGLDGVIAEYRRRGSLQATTDPFDPVLGTDISFVCVGTPSNGNGSLDLSGVKAVAWQIGRVLKRKSSHHCVVFRSTVLPGTMRNELIPILCKASQKKAHRDFDVCFNPEFLREGTAVSDFYHPPLVVIGQETSRGGDIVARLYDGFDAPLERTTYETAEMLKYACNSFHALKVTFANEIGVLSKSLGIDGQRVMELFTLDGRLNLSPAYLKPGFAFGGSCLGKDLRALLYKAKEMDVNAPLLSAIRESNRLHIQRAIDWVLSKKPKSVGILGLSFKSGTDDLRESPSVVLAEALIGKGCRLRIYDSDVVGSTITGANKRFIEREIPHIATLLCGAIDEVVQESDVIVICKPDGIRMETLGPRLDEKVVLDLVRLRLDRSATAENYEGLCWQETKSLAPAYAAR